MVVCLHKEKVLESPDLNTEYLYFVLLVKEHCI